MSNPDVTDWVGGPQGYFILGILGSLMGVTIITVMHRPKIPDGFLGLLSLRPSLKEIQPGWFLVGIAVAGLVHLHPKTWDAGGAILLRAIRAARTNGGLAYVVGAVVLGPIGEELILRGYLYQGFRASYGKTIGTIIIMVLSVLLHASGVHYGSFVHVVLALLLCWIFETRKNLLDCMVFHIAYNATVVCHAILVY